MKPEYYLVFALFGLLDPLDVLKWTVEKLLEFESPLYPEHSVISNLRCFPV